jgi:Cu(I)/Ag(I) efflux system membrane fusion protein
LAELYSPTLLQAEREYRALTGELHAATALRLQQMGLNATQIEALGKKPNDQMTSQILAPVGGTVLVQRVFEGQYIQEGELLFEIADFSNMWFQFRAYEQDLPWIQRGLRVDTTTPSHPGRIFSGEITFIDPSLDEATRSAQVRVELENPLVDGHRLLLQRLYAEGRVHLQAPDVLTVPRTAVIQTGPQAIVYVEQKDGAYERRPIKTGRRGDSLLEVLAGLTAGEKVVVNGNLLIDGQAEMNRAFDSHAAVMNAAMATNAPPLTDPQKEVVRAFIKAADAVAAALANDDVAAFNKSGSEAMRATEALAQALTDRADLADMLKHLSDARHLHEATDLAAARKLFHPFANAGARVVELLSKDIGANEFALFECPMVDRAIPGVPKKGRWVQTAERPLANPYFGSAMVDCGAKVNL